MSADPVEEPWSFFASRSPRGGPESGPPAPVRHARRGGSDPAGRPLGELPTATYPYIIPASRGASMPYPAAPTVPRGGGATGPQVDYGAVRHLHTEIGEALTGWLRGGTDATDADIRFERDQIATQMVARHADLVRRGGTPMTSDDEAALLSSVRAEMVGLGRLQRLLDDKTVEEVHILGCDRVRITHRDGRIELGEPIAGSDDEMVEVLQTLARRAGATERALSTAHPMLDLQLPGGERLAAAFQVSHRPYAVIRQHMALDVSLEDIAGGDSSLDMMIDPLICDFLRAAVAAGVNVMIAGRAGEGKTTLLRALAGEIPVEEPFVVLEESRELGLQRNGRHRWVMSFESRDGHGVKGPDGRPAGEVSIADLIPVALRMGAQRVIVGEVRSREVVPMLEAMSTSHGSMCTVHARCPDGVTDRIVQLAMTYGPAMTAELAQRATVSALDLIVYLNLRDDTPVGGRRHRYVSSIEEITGLAGGQIVRTTVFGPDEDGRAVPRDLPVRLRHTLARVGYDVTAHLAPWIEARRGAWHHGDQAAGRHG